MLTKIFFFFLIIMILIGTWKARLDFWYYFFLLSILLSILYSVTDV